MFDVVLFRPEIPPNTGNVIRLCANTGCRLHLVRPYGFRIDDRSLVRAGLDYDVLLAGLVEHDDWDACRASFGDRRIFAFSTRGTARHTDVSWRRDDVLLFGQETSGLPADLLASFPPAHRVKLPMLPRNRSVNLSNAVAVAVYEAWRQLGFEGAA